MLHVAAYTTRNWTLSEEVSRRQINDLWEAIHEIPDVIKRWRSDEEGLTELRMCFRCYDEKWGDLRLEVLFDEAMRPA